MIEYRCDFIRDPVSNAPMPDELRQAFPFHIESCGRFYTADKYFTKRNGLQNYLVIYTTEGCGQMCSQGQSCLLKPGSAVLIDCSTDHEYNTLPGSVWNFYYLHFRALSFNGFSGILLNELTPVSLRDPEQGEKIFRELYEVSFMQSVAAYVRQSNLISNLLTEMVCSLEEENQGGAKVNRKDIAELAEYIRAHFHEEMHIEDFMRFTRLSRYYLIHSFEQQIGMPPYRYMHLCRIRHAEILLQTTDMTVSQISDSVGYRDPAVFIRHFKIFHAISPGAYRKQASFSE